MPQPDQPQPTDKVIVAEHARGDTVQEILDAAAGRCRCGGCRRTG